MAHVGHSKSKSELLLWTNAHPFEAVEHACSRRCIGLEQDQKSKIGQEGEVDAVGERGSFEDREVRQRVAAVHLAELIVEVRLKFGLLEFELLQTFALLEELEQFNPSIPECPQVLARIEYNMADARIHQSKSLKGLFT